MELNFRTLTPSEIDARVGQVVYNEKRKGVTLLLYKDARVDMALLDEVVKPMNWKREHKRDNANCVVSIWDENKKEWISKEDTGTESNTEAEKGLASDSFKRACVNWGIGRELYTAPLIFIELTDKEFYKQGDKYFLQKYIKFSVKEIAYDGKRQICKLIIVDQQGKIKFSFSKPQELTEEQKEEMDALFSDIEATEDMNQLCKCVALSEGKPYEKQVRAKANERACNKGWSK